jgi:hypothetical protein
VEPKLIIIQIGCLYLWALKMYLLNKGVIFWKLGCSRVEFKKHTTKSNLVFLVIRKIFDFFFLCIPGIIYIFSRRVSLFLEFFCPYYKSASGKTRPISRSVIKKMVFCVTFYFCIFFFVIIRILVSVYFPLSVSIEISDRLKPISEKKTQFSVNMI